MTVPTRMSGLWYLLPIYLRDCSLFCWLLLRHLHSWHVFPTLARWGRFGVRHLDEHAGTDAIIPSRSSRLSCSNANNTDPSITRCVRAQLAHLILLLHTCLFTVDFVGKLQGGHRSAGVSAGVFEASDLFSYTDSA